MPHLVRLRETGDDVVEHAEDVALVGAVVVAVMLSRNTGPSASITRR